LAAKNYKKLVWVFIKAAISLAGLYWAYSKTDIDALGELLNNSNFFWLIPSVILYAASKWVSAFRLNIYLNDVGATLSSKQSVLLYWLGLFYNLFLPGGIGGDAYKVILLNKYLKSPWKKNTSAILYDRIIGMITLLFLAAFLSMWLPIYYLLYVGLIVIILLIPVFGLATRFLFPDFFKNFWKGYLLSLIVQGFQLLAALIIYRAMLINEHIPALLFLFLISSVVAILPFTIGGVGARELTFLYGAQWMGVSPEIGVGFSLLFFLVSVLVSVPGILISEKKIFSNTLDV